MLPQKFSAATTRNRACEAPATEAAPTGAGPERSHAVSRSIKRTVARMPARLWAVAIGPA